MARQHNASQLRRVLEDIIASAESDGTSVADEPAFTPAVG
jgi:hypothetical protein